MCYIDQRNLLPNRIVVCVRTGVFVQLASDIGAKSARIPITAATMKLAGAPPDSPTTLLTGGRVLLTQLGSDRLWNSLNFQVNASSLLPQYYLQDIAICPSCAAPVFVDALGPGWETWSWDARLDWQSKVTRSSADTLLGHRSVQVRHVASWSTLVLRNPRGFGPTGEILFSVRGLDAGAELYMQLRSEFDASLSTLTPLKAVATGDDEAFLDMAVDLSEFGGFGKVWHQLHLKVGRLDVGAELVYNIMDMVICSACGAPLP